jgi:integrase
MGRRGHDEGSIYQRESDGKWVAAVNLGYASDGKRKRKVFYGDTRKEVAEKLKTALHEHQQGTLPTNTERQTVEQFLTNWLQNTAKQTLRASTFETYEIHVRVHLVPALGRLQLSKLNPQHIQQFINQKLEQGLKPRTVIYSYAVLSRALGQALKWGLVGRNVAELVDPPRAPRSEIRPFTAEQARALLEAVKGHRLEAFYTVALSLGLRRGEALGLMWEDVDLQAGTVRVKQALQRLGGKLQITEVKSATSRRVIKLPRVCVAALKSHHAQQLQEKLLAGAGWTDTGLVFTSHLGTPLEPRTVARHFQRTLKQADLPRIRIHDLRHTAASLLLAQGVPVKMVSEILGHSGSRITLDVYGHVFDSTRQQAADRMDDLLSGAP